MIFSEYFLQSITNIPIDGFKDAAKVSILDGVLVSISTVLSGVIIFLYKTLVKKETIITKNQEIYSNNLDCVRKEHAIKLEHIRKEMFEHNEERNRQWVESEKETLNVLNGVSRVLEMNEKINENDTEKILQQIKNSEKIITTRISLLEKK